MSTVLGSFTNMAPLDLSLREGRTMMAPVPHRPSEGVHAVPRRDALKLLGTAGLGLLAAGRTAPLGAAPVPLRYWTWLNSADTKNPRARAQAEILAAFRKTHPNINLVEEVLPWQNLQHQLLQAAAANKAPDVSRQLDRWVPTLARAEAILPLDEFVKDWAADRKNDYLHSWDDTVVEGRKFAFRQAVRPVNLMYYRTDLLSAAGFKSPPRTLSEFTSAAKATTKGQVIGFLLPFSKADGLALAIQQLPPMYWAFGSDLVDLETGKAIFHLAAGQKIFQWFQDMVHVHKVSPVGQASMDAETADQMFIAGTTAMHFEHSSKWADWSKREALRGRVATAWTPNFADQAKTVPVNTAGAWTLVMSKGASREAAWKLIEFFQSPEAELIDARTGGELPTRKSTLKDPFFQTAEAKQMMSWLTYLSENPHPATLLKIKKIETLVDVLADAAQQIIASRADVKSTLALAAQKYDAQAK